MLSQTKSKLIVFYISYKNYDKDDNEDNDDWCADFCRPRTWRSTRTSGSAWFAMISACLAMNTLPNNEYRNDNSVENNAEKYIAMEIVIALGCFRS